MEKTEKTRQKRYTALFDKMIPDYSLEDICHSINPTRVLGDERFRRQRASINYSDYFGFLVCLLKTLASIAGFENDMRTERQAEGVVRTKEDGRQFGAPSKLMDTKKQETYSRRMTGALLVN